MANRREFLGWTAAALGGSPLTAAADSPPPTGSDVGSLYPFIRSQAVRGEFPLSYLQDRFKDVPAWKKEARGKLLELLHYAPPPCDPKPEVVERADKGSYVREKVYFNTTPDIRVPAYVLVPKRAGRLPAVVALHDHGGFYFWGKEKIVATEDEHPPLAKWKKTYYGDAAIADVLAAKGYVVVVIDMFYWGERRLLLDGDPADWRDRPRAIPEKRVREFNARASESESLVGRTIYAAGFTWPGVMFWDDVRTVDYLLTRPEVDPARIGCVGLSVGGLRAAHLAALDDRVKAAVAVGWMASFPPQLKKHIRHTIGHTKVVPGLMRHLDYPDVAALAMPRALMVINGSKDSLFEPAGVDASFAKLNACYQKAGVPEKCRTRLFDAPHEFNAAMQAEAWDWLKKWV
ncbi:MAG: dienelactone hydrolase family protein [Gemmataceae bacterium]|nr:dienelactone hydrolase family protein [Gemmataceae bacterium]